MPLSSKTWTPVGIHSVVLAWIRAEQSDPITIRQWKLFRPESGWPRISTLLDDPNLDDAIENRARLRLLYLIRSRIVVELSPDMEWYRVDALTVAELGELHVINHH